MKFKSLYFLSALFVSACCLTSCEEGTGENTDELETIFWNKSAAFQMQLKGKVKTLAIDTTEEFSFDQSGNLESSVYMQHETTTYTYSSGRLTRMITVSDWGYNEIFADTTDVTYGTSGKYLPVYTYDLLDNGLFKNLASHSSGNSTTIYEMSGDSMLMIYTQMENHYDYAINYTQSMYADTTSLTFNGGAFPVTIRSNYSVTNVTYAPDGRFLTIEELFRFHGGSTLTTFKSNSNYIIPISIERVYGTEDPEITTYTYNDKEDLTYEDGYYYDYEYSDYVYDANDNWISRSRRVKNREDVWTDKVTETRVITYWD